MYKRQAIPIILKYKNKDGKLQLGGTFQELTSMHQFLGYNIHRLAEATGIKKMCIRDRQCSVFQFKEETIQNGQRILRINHTADSL